MRTHLFTILVFSLLICTGGTQALSSDLSPKQILTHSDTARGNASGLQWSISLHSSENGRQQKRELLLKSKGVNSLAIFESPAKVKGRKLLMKDRNMWFIKPSIKKPIPISPRQKLMGGASNGDIASTNYAGDYEVTTNNEDKIDNEECYLFDLKAKNKKVTYDRIRYWISKKRLVGIYAEFYTVSGKKIKTAQFEYSNSITINNEQRPFVSEMVITDALIPENITTLSYSKVKIQDISDASFNLNLLTR